MSDDMKSWAVTPTEWLIHPAGRPVDLPHGPEGRGLLRLGVDNEGVGAFLVLRNDGGASVRIDIAEVPALCTALRMAARRIEAAEAKHVTRGDP